jgi:hypothetical protein
MIECWMLQSAMILSCVERGHTYPNRKHLQIVISKFSMQKHVQIPIKKNSVGLVHANRLSRFPNRPIRFLRGLRSPATRQTGLDSFGTDLADSAAAKPA